MNTKNVISSIVISVIVVFLGFTVFGGKTETVIEKTIVERQVGSGAGQDSSFHQFFLSQVTIGGITVATTSTATTYTLTAAELQDRSVINWLPNVNTTLSIGATSTYGMIPRIGDRATIYLRNASTTVASTITLAGVNANTDMQIAETSGGDMVIEGLNYAQLTFVRLNTNADNSVAVIVSEFKPGD